MATNMCKIHFVLYGSAMIIFVVLAERQQLSIYEKFRQSDFKLKFEHMDVDYYNKNALKMFKIVTYKHNRTCTAFNISWELKIDVNNNLEVIIQSYRFASNEYRLFPLRLQVNGCRALSSNLIGLSNMGKCGNFTGCPFKKGIMMHSCKWTPDESRNPPFVPTGRYLLDIQLMHGSIELGLIKSYTEVYRPIPYPD